SSMTFIIALVILTWGSRWCFWVIALGGVFVVAIAWTRLYLGVHYPSDILAGWAASIAWAIGVRLLIKPQSMRKEVAGDN
ncbi:MAG: phosphatase PAP2 family protein, partial [Kovacikia sp.]